MKQKCFPGNLKIKIFYSTSQIFRKYNHQTGFCLLLGLSVSWLVVMFGIWFVCLWVGKYVIMPFNSRDDVSVGLFY